MSALPQLIMRKADISTLPPLELPEGFDVCRHQEGCGMEAEWERIIESAFEKHFGFDFLINAGDYAPEHVLYISHGGRLIATASAVENPNFKGEGWYRMVGVHADARGLGAGRMICLAALYDLRERGYASALLSTDDRRLPAISLYLSLGFEPVYSHESHRERWEKVFEKIAEYKRNKK